MVSAVSGIDPDSSKEPEKEKTAVYDDNTDFIQEHNAAETAQNAVENLQTPAAAQISGQNDGADDVPGRNKAEMTPHFIEDPQVTIATPANDDNDKDAVQERPPRRAAAEKAKEKMSSLKKSANKSP